MTIQGKLFKGAKRELRRMKRVEAEERNALTPPERKSQKRVKA